MSQNKPTGHRPLNLYENVRPRLQEGTRADNAATIWGRTRARIRGAAASAGLPGGVWTSRSKPARRTR